MTYNIHFYETQSYPSYTVMNECPETMTDLAWSDIEKIMAKDGVYETFRNPDTGDRLIYSGIIENESGDIVKIIYTDLTDF